MKRKFFSLQTLLFLRRKAFFQSKAVPILLVGILFCCIGHAQEKRSRNKGNGLGIGLNYGQASQRNFPLGNPNYYYKNSYFKIQINYPYWVWRKASIEFHMEPSIYFSEYQLLNEFFIQPKMGSDYLEQRDVYTKKAAFKEYALNIGAIYRYTLIKGLAVYAMGSVGPMTSKQGTERLKKGFAFSDIIGAGLSYKLKKVLFDLRFTLRHNSNANLYVPNIGHNSSGIESGILLQL